MKNVCLSLTIIGFLAVAGLGVALNSYQNQQVPTTMSLGFPSLPQINTAATL